MIPNIITFTEWQTIKQYGNLTKDFKNFNTEELDNIVVFYDNNKNYIDYLERSKIEKIIPSEVLLPKFFWEKHLENIPIDYLPEININDRIEMLNKNHKIVSDRLFYRPNTLIPLGEDKKPRDEQIEIIKIMNELIISKNRINGIVQAIPGFGKTIVSLLFASMSRTKTLIVVPNELLNNQWLQAIVEFTELTENEVGMIQGHDIIKNKIEIGPDKKITLVKIQSINSQIKNNPVIDLIEFYKDFDLVFYDEAHTSAAANSYAKTSSLMSTQNIIGLTATPYRTGLNDYLLKVSTGELIYKSTHQNLIPDIEIHKVYVPSSKNENDKIQSVKFDYNMTLGVFNSFMVSKTDYFNYIADVINYNHSNGHNIVILLPTIKLMENLKNILLMRHPHLEDDQLLLKGKTKEDMQIMVKTIRKELMTTFKAYKEEQELLVKAKKIKRKDYQVLIKDRRSEIQDKIEYVKEHALDLYNKITKKARIIISNPNLLQAGYDDPKLSNLIIAAAPRIGSVPVIQSIGRVTRIFDDKPKPLAQYFIPSTFYEINDKVNIILTNNIKKQYPTASINYLGEA